MGPAASKQMAEPGKEAQERRPTAALPVQKGCGGRWEPRKDQAGWQGGVWGRWEVLAGLPHPLTLIRGSVCQPSRPILGPMSPPPALISFHKY